MPANAAKILLITRHAAGLCYATVGVHPCSAKTFETYAGGPPALLDALKDLAISAKEAGYATAFGEIGLDYDRLYLTEKDQQLKYFEAQLDIAKSVQLPLFLHSRAASEDFERLLASRLPSLPKKGLVHSFTGTIEEMERLVAMGLDIGINGCSMKTEENLEVVRAVPLERLQIETDGPWVSVCPAKPPPLALASTQDLLIQVIAENSIPKVFRNDLLTAMNHDSVKFEHLMLRPSIPK